MIFGRLPPGADVRANWKDLFSVKNFAMCISRARSVSLGIKHRAPRSESEFAPLGSGNSHECKAVRAGREIGARRAAGPGHRHRGHGPAGGRTSPGPASESTIAGSHIADSD